MNHDAVGVVVGIGVDSDFPPKRSEKGQSERGTDLLETIHPSPFRKLSDPFDPDTDTDPDPDEDGE
jgi:hypothetical protein